MSGYSNKRAAKERRKKMLLQRLVGLCLFSLSILIFSIALNGKTVEDRDCTVLFLIVPMSLKLIFGKDIIIY